MDTGKGVFEFIEAENNDLEIKKAVAEKKYPNHGGWFHVGEIFEIKGSLFKVTKVTATKLTLKLQRRNKG